MKKMAILLMAVVLLAGCMSMGTDVVVEKGINSGQIRLGASKDEVAAVTGRPGLDAFRESSRRMGATSYGTSRTGEDVEITW